MASYKSGGEKAAASVILGSYIPSPSIYGHDSEIFSKFGSWDIHSASRVEVSCHEPHYCWE